VTGQVRHVTTRDSLVVGSTAGAFGKCCQTDLYRTVWNRPSVRKVVSDRSDRSAHFRTSADSDYGASSCYIPFSRSVWHRLLRFFFTSIDIKIERSVFGDRSKRPTEPTHFRTLWVRSDQTPLTFRPFSERVFLRSDRSDQTDRRFRTHPARLIEL
jgi:hypothetical protein